MRLVRTALQELMPMRCPALPLIRPAKPGTFSR
jgi:hypothetical protein